MDFPRLLQTGARAITGDVDAANSRPEQNTSGSSGVEGAWVETFASTPFDAFGINVSIAPLLNATNNRLFDIGIGASGSEQVIVKDLICGNRADAEMYHAYLPLKIPSGSRLAHRSLAGANSQGSFVGMTLVGGGFQGHQASCSRCQTLGEVATSAPGGTQIDPGGTAGVKGGYTDVPASTTTLFHGRWLGIGLDNKVNLSRADANWLVDIAINVAGTRYNILENIHIASDVNQSMQPDFIGPFPLAIPAGAQLSVQAACSITEATDRLFGIILYVFG